MFILKKETKKSYAKLKKWTVVLSPSLTAGRFQRIVYLEIVKQQPRFDTRRLCPGLLVVRGWLQSWSGRTWEFTAACAAVAPRAEGSKHRPGLDLGFGGRQADVCRRGKVMIVR